MRLSVCQLLAKTGSWLSGDHPGKERKKELMPIIGPLVAGRCQESCFTSLVF